MYLEGELICPCCKHRLKLKINNNEIWAKEA